MNTSPVTAESELSTKLERIHELLIQFKLDALLLHRVDNFSWLTCGASSYVNTADAFGNASLLITPTSRYVVLTSISGWPTLKVSLDRQEIERQAILEIN